MNNLDFFAATGNVKSCLTLSADFSITGGVLSVVGAVSRIQEEGSNLPLRPALNFVGGSATAADDAGNNRINVTFDGDLNAIAVLSGTGAAVKTAPDTWTLQPDFVVGPASATDNAIARFDLTTGKLIQNSAVTVADTSGNFSVPNDWIVSSAGGSSVQLTSVAQEFVTPTRSTTGRNFGFTAGTQTQSSGTIVGKRLQTTYNQTSTAASSDYEVVRVETALGAGEHNFIKGFGGAAGSTYRFRINNLGNYFFGATGGFIGDENGNEYLKFNTVSSAVNELQVSNAAAAGRPSLTATGSDTDIDFDLSAKGAGFLRFLSNAAIVKANPNFDLNDSGTVARYAVSSGSVFITRVGQSDIALNLSTGVATFGQIPVLPASSPTTANQATRKQYVDDRRVSFTASFAIVDPATANLTLNDFGSIVIPAGGTYTITKFKVLFREGSHTSGGSLTFQIIQVGVGAVSTSALKLDNTNSAVNTIYTDDVGDFTVAENTILSMGISARSGTITEKDVVVVIEGFRTVF
jgi:hypothetical protein